MKNGFGDFYLQKLLKLRYDKWNIAGRFLMFICKNSLFLPVIRFCRKKIKQKFEAKSFFGKLKK